MTGHRRDQLDLFFVTALARGLFGQRAHEVVRRVAPLAVGAAVKSLVRRGNLVAAAARPRSRIAARARRMRVVTTHAGTRCAALRVIGMSVLVALGAGPLRRTAHVVRRVACVALRMRADPRRAEHVHVFVAAPAGDGTSLLELMGPMATDTFGVTFGEERTRRHFGVLFRVTSRTAGSRCGCRRVLLLVTHAARRARRPALRGMPGRHVGVAGRTRRGLGFGVLVRAMTPQALAAGVDFDPRELSLFLAVTAPAIAYRVFLGGKRMATGTVRARRRAEALLCLPRRVLDLRFLRMAGGTAGRLHGPDRVVGELMALCTRDLLFHDVHLVPGRSAGALPLRPHVDPEPVARPVAAFRASRGDRGHHHGNQPGRRELAT